MVELDMDTVDAVAVAAGPGSFTGLRIGSATAKGLAFAMEKPVIPVPTLEGLAWQMYGTDALVCPIMDARRSQVYTGLYEFVDRSHKEAADSSAFPDGKETVMSEGETSENRYDMRVVKNNVLSLLLRLRRRSTGSAGKLSLWGMAFLFSGKGCRRFCGFPICWRRHTATGSPPRVLPRLAGFISSRERP